MEVYGLLLLAGWNAAELAVDIVPLFETVDDLEAAPQVMKALYENSVLRQTPGERGKTQTIMLGFQTAQRWRLPYGKLGYLQSQG